MKVMYSESVSNPALLKLKKNPPKVYLPAIEGYVPDKMIKTMRAFLDFCYLARHDTLTDDTLNELDEALARFHRHREIFCTTGIRPKGFSLPRQHAMSHYRRHIENFGVPNGLCSSITESKHIKAVKEPWRRSNRFKALGQMLLTNQRLDKLAAARVKFTHYGLLAGTCLSETLARTNNWADSSFDFPAMARTVSEGEDCVVDDRNCEDTESGPVEELEAIADVKLPLNRRKFSF